MYAQQRRRTLNLDGGDSSSEDNSPIQDRHVVLGEEVHAPGALIRIKMKNFVTYSSAEFKCGPSLNMVLGPNGTGKSSLVCAICLGLGWAPAQLGRAKEIGEFVKNGFREAEIEIELKAGARHRGRNPVVKRVIKREGNKSTWFINGTGSTHKEVQGLMKYFGIQVDNLCQFLPQDKVADFAAMSPVELLEQTQKAVGTAEMTEWHDSLRKLGADRRKHINEKEHIDRILSELQTRQNQQKAEVERLQERSALQFRLNALEKHRVSVKYQEEKDRYDVARNRKQEAKAELTQLQSEVEPLLQDANSKEDYRNRLQGLLGQRKQLVERSKKNVDTVLNKAEAHKGKIDECNNRINTARASKSKRNSELLKKRNKIALLEGRLKNEPPSFDPREFNEKRREKDNERRQIKARIGEIDSTMQPMVTEFKSLRTQSGQIQSEINQLSTKSGQQIQKLRQLSADSHKAWKAIQEMSDKFEHEVFGPPLVSCSLKDPELADAVETVLQRNDMMAFTVQSQKDSRTLQDLLYRQQKLTDVSVRTILQKVSQFQRPMQDAALKDYGFDGWLLDALEGPEPVLAMLCDSSRLHRIAYSSSVDKFDLDRVKQSPLESFVVKDQFYTINRRLEYGPDAVSTQLRQTRAKGLWTDSGSNMSGESELKQQLQNIEERKESTRADFDKLKSEKKSLDEKVQELTTQITAIDRDKSELQRARSLWELIPVELETAKEELQAAIDLHKQEDDDVQRWVRKKQKLAFERGQFAIDYSIALNTVRKMMNDQFEVELLFAEAESDLKHLQSRNKEITQLLITRQKEIEDLNHNIAKLKRTCLDLRRKFEAQKANCTEEEKLLQDEFDMRCRDEGNETGEARSAELEAEITSVTQRLELVHSGNPHIIQEYEKRAQEIERIFLRVTNIDGDISALDEQINDIRSRWEPQLDELISEINDAFAHNFAQIKCAGQVSVHKDEEDFGEWAVKIMVSFRNNDNLSVLTSQRQSGGERSVTTIFYLMALQSKARSPFRVVDEINQGMDPRNERMVHERMVDIACSENTSQYFLITPKLLSGLKYHERMVVHTIYSGETMPENNSNLDFGKWADLSLRLAGMVN